MFRSGSIAGLLAVDWRGTFCQTQRMNLQELINQAAEGAEIVVPPGTHAANLRIERSISLVGGADAREHVLSGDENGAVITIDGPQIAVRLVGLTISNGSDEVGAGVAVLSGKVDIERCTLSDNRAPMYGGGGLFVGMGLVTMSGCVLTRNTGRQGGAILADQAARLALRGCVVAGNAALRGGAVAVRDEAALACLHCTLADNRAEGACAEGEVLSVAGTTTSQPTVDIVSCVIQSSGEARVVVNSESCPGQIAVRHSLLPAGIDGISDGGGNAFGDPGFAGDTLALGPDSAALGLADTSSIGPDDRDSRGNARLRSGRADAGAYAFVP